MKTKLLTLMMLSLVACSASAGVSESKPVTKIDFNNMIDQNNNDRNKLKDGIDASVESQAAIEERAEKTKVIDFIDVEVGWGEAPTVVDRRFDSVDEDRN